MKIVEHVLLYRLNVGASAWRTIAVIGVPVSYRFRQGNVSYRYIVGARLS
jgi:hypothetical protein